MFCLKSLTRAARNFGKLSIEGYCKTPSTAKYNTLLGKSACTSRLYVTLPPRNPPSDKLIQHRVFFDPSEEENSQYELMINQEIDNEISIVKDGDKSLYQAEYFDSPEKILQVLGEGPSKELINLQCAGPIVRYLYGTKADGVEIVKMLKRQPFLLQVSEAKWREHVGILLEHGFQPVHVVRMLSLCPSILTTMKIPNMMEVFAFLRKLAMGEKLMLAIMRYRPVILTMSADDIEKQIVKLKDVFPRKDIIKLLPACPNILFESFSDLNEKVQYVLFKMNLEQKDIVECRLLTYTMDYIKLRCEFIKRCGRFIPPNPKKRKLIKNPSLRDIVDTPDVVFATKICGVSTREYAVFPHLFLLENQDKQEEDEENKYFDAMVENYRNFKDQTISKDTA